MSTSSAPHQSSPVTALDALLTLEAAVAKRLERAREEAAEVIERANLDATEYTRQSHEALAAALASLDARQVTALAEIELEVSRAADTMIAYFRGLSDEDVARIADAVISEVSGLPAPATTPSSLRP